MNCFKRSIRLIAAAFIAVSGLLVATPAYAAPSNITKYPIPSAGDITSGPDGNMWVILPGKIGKITPGGALTQYQLPDSSTPVGITSGPGGNMWFTETRDNHGIIGKITPSGNITEYPLTQQGYLRFITKGADGNVWFTEPHGDKIGKITPDGNITEYPIPTSGAFPVDITSGPDGNVWFTENHEYRIGKITPSGNITEYLLTFERYPYSITNGPDGNMWFTEWDGEIGRITVDGKITEYNGHTNPYPYLITSGSDGNLWFTANSNASIINQITTSGDVFQYSFAATASGRFSGITTSHDGKLWATAGDGIIAFDPRIPPISIPEYGAVEATVACGSGLIMFAFLRRRHIELARGKDL